MAGEIPVAFAGASVAPQIQAGKLRALATAGKKRLPGLPEVPTIAEFYPGFETTSWVGLIAPASTLRPVIDKLNATLAKILAAPDMKEKFDTQSAEIVASTPEYFGELIRSESAKWGKIIREKNIRTD
jgi:tripartite-type tricarboxylate transporter receptor subunit TctC